MPIWKGVLMRVHVLFSLRLFKREISQQQSKQQKNNLTTSGISTAIHLKAI